MVPARLRSMTIAAFCGLIGIMLLSASAFAIEPDEILKDPALEARARAISAELRCPVCQNQSIDDSHAPLARDLRILVRDRLIAGDTDSAVKQFLVARYGEFVLLKPPLEFATLVLWSAPLLLLLAAGVMIARRTPRTAAGAATPDTPLTPEEQARLAQLLEDRETAAVAKSTDAAPREKS